MPSENAMPNSVVNPVMPDSAMPNSIVADSAIAQNPYDTHATTEITPDFAQSDLAWGSYVESVGVLLALLFLLCLCFWAVRRFGLFSMVPNAASLPRHALRLEGQMALGPRKGLMVVRCLDRRLVLGVTDQHISLLTELPLDFPVDTDGHDDIDNVGAGNNGGSSDATSPTGPDAAHNRKTPDATIIKSFSALMRKKP